MPQEPQEQGPELEALLQTGMQSNEKLNEIESNTEMSMMKLDTIDANTEASVLALDKIHKTLTTEKERPKVTVEGAEFITLKGEKGDKGDKGDQGEKGDKGDQGIQGETGADSTVQGPKGDKGDKGDRGEVGPQGISGKDSTVPGPIGPQGPKGKDGKTPKKGADYLTDDEVAEMREEIATEAHTRARNAISAKTYSLREMDDLDQTGNNNNSTIQYQTATGKWFTGVSVTVSQTAPTDPKLHDLWISLP